MTGERARIWPPSTVLAPLLVVFWLLLFSCPVPAQSLDYGNLTGLGSGGGSAAQQSAPQQSVPLQSTPVPGSGFDAGSVPTAQQYGALDASDADPMLSAARQGVALFRARLISTVHRLPEAWGELRTALSVASPTGKPSYFIGIAIFATMLLVLGRAVNQFYVVYVARRLFLSVQRPNPVGYSGKLPVLAYRIGLTLIGIVIVVSVAAAVGLVFYQEHEATLVTVIVVFATYAACMVADTVWRMMLAPYMPEYRLPVVDDSAARSLYLWLSVITCFILISLGFGAWMEALGLSTEVQVAIRALLRLVTLLACLALIRVHRRTIATMMLGGQPRSEASWLTLLALALWGPVLAVLLIATWADSTFRLIMGVETGSMRMLMPLLILFAGLVFYAVACFVIERLFARARAMRVLNRETETGEAEDSRAIAVRADGIDADADGDEESGGGGATAAPEPILLAPTRGMRTIEDLARRIASLLALGAIVYFLVELWGGEEIFEENAWLALIEDLADTLLMGYAAYHAVRIWMDQKIADEGGDELPAGPGEGEGGGAGASRLATLLPLVRNFVLIIIMIAVALVLASELGINIAPLFAGAGILGLAIGFGSQTLVRDILSGAFFLMDDAFRKGEYIDVGDVKGTVEKISLRSFQLRHHLGMLHTIPFGEIQYLTNFSRDWVMMKLPLRVTYDTDPERVRKLIKKLGLALLEDPEIGEKFIQPLKSQGVIQMDDSAMIIRVKFMTYPGEQWVLRKRVFQEIRALFEAEGIKFAHREVTVRVADLPDGRDLSDGEVKAIGAAARRVGDQVEEEMMATGAGGVGDVR